MSKKLRVFEAFAGYGSQSIALKNLGIEYEVVAISEIDPDALIAYGAIRDMKIDKNINLKDAKEELMNMNVGFDFQNGKSSIPRIKDDKLIKLYSAHKVSNNLGDISKIKVEDIPEHDLFTYSFPCQDISIAGKQEGIEKGLTRSGLLYECEKIIEHHKPKYLLMENVKNLVSKKFKPQFDEWLKYLEGLGYISYYEVLNAKDYGVPQNRERVFVVSILGEHKSYEFTKHSNTKDVRDYLETEINEEFNISDKFREQIKNTNFRKDNYINDTFNIIEGRFKGFKIMDYRYDEGLRIRKNNLCPTLTTRGRGGLSGTPIIYNDGDMRFLSEREYFRLMGLSDCEINKIQNIGISSSKQYKMAGNSIVVDVLEGIFKELLLNNK